MKSYYSISFIIQNSDNNLNIYKIAVTFFEQLYKFPKMISKYDIIKKQILITFSATLTI